MILMQSNEINPGIKMTSVSKTSLLKFVVFARFLALTAKLLAAARPPKKARTDYEPVQNYTFQK